MKKGLLFTLFLAIGATSFAQEQEGQVKNRQATQDKDVYGGWYNYGEMLSAAGLNVDYYRNHLFPDSSVQVEFSSGMGYQWKHTMGQVFDPAGDNWAIGGQVPIDVTDPYTVDSIRIWYQYHRHQQTNPDTLKVQVYNQSALSTYEDPWANGQSYATAQYDYMTNTGIGAAQEYTILLTQADTMTYGQSTIDISIDMDVNPDEIIAVTVAYVPGNSWNFGDTIDQYMATPPTNQINAFIMYDYWDNDTQFETGYYNHGLLTPSDIRYNENPNNWNGVYYPGIAYFSGTDHSDIDFHVVGTVGIQEENASDFAMYPNPANETLTLKLNEGVELKAISIVDITGKEVRSLVSVTGNQIDISQLANGSYFLTHSVDGQTTTKQFVVSH